MVDGFLLCLIMVCTVFAVINMCKHFTKKPEKKFTVDIDRGTATYDPAFNHFIKITNRNPVYFCTETVLVLKEDLEKILKELEKHP